MPNLKGGDVAEMICGAFFWASASHLEGIFIYDSTFRHLHSTTTLKYLQWSVNG